jgi:hypothetical protein
VNVERLHAVAKALREGKQLRRFSDVALGCLNRTIGHSVAPRDTGRAMSQKPDTAPQSIRTLRSRGYPARREGTLQSLTPTKTRENDAGGSSRAQGTPNLKEVRRDGP